MHDLTAFLTTVAAASASIVAILGGFIASKLISIGSERNAVISKIQELEEQQLLKETELNTITEELTRDDAWSFISDHITDVIKENDINHVYTQNEQQYISIEKLRPYWERAVNIWNEVTKFYKEQNNGNGENSDKIPNSLAEKYSSDDFDYNVCKKLIKEIRKSFKIQQSQSSLYEISDIYNMDMDVEVADPFGTSFKKDRIAAIQSELNWIKLQQKQYSSQKNSLKKPKGIIAGLIIFAAFSIGCIIFPLGLAPRTVESLKELWATKLIVLGIFAVGLGSIFGYLIYLLKWKE